MAKLNISGYEGYIAGVRKQLSDKNQATIDELNETFAIDFDEHFSYQNFKNEMMLNDTIDEDTAQQIYIALGELHTEYNGGWADGVDLATKFTISKIMAEFLSMKLKARGVRV